MPEIDTAHRAGLVDAELEDVGALEQHLAVALGALGQQPHQPATESRLAAAGLPHQAEGLARLQREVDPVDGPDRPAGRPVPDPEVADVHHRAGPTLGLAVLLDDRHRVSSSTESRAGMSTGINRRLRRVGLTVSLRPSPTSVTAVMRMTIARPGYSEVHQMPGLRVVEGSLQVEAPVAGLGRLDAETEEAQPGQRDQGVGHVQGRDDRHALDRRCRTGTCA